MYINLAGPYINQGGSSGNNIGSSGDSRAQSRCERRWQRLLDSWTPHIQGWRRLHLSEPASTPISSSSSPSPMRSPATSTRQDPTTKLATGNSLVSALLGTPATFTGQTPNNAGSVLQHAIVVGLSSGRMEGHSNLTLNFGLRYEYLPSIQMLDKRTSQCARHSESDLYHLGFVGPRLLGDVLRIRACSGGIDAVPFKDHIKFRK